MPLENEDLTDISKADISTATGGQMEPEELQSFIDTGVEQVAVLNEEFEVVEVTASKMNMDIMDLAEENMRKGEEGVEVTTPRGINISRRTLEPTEVTVYYRITDKFLRRNIMRQGAESVINSRFSKQYMVDAFNLSLNGDTSLNANDYPFHSINDGIIVKALADDDVNDEITFADADKLSAIFASMLDAMPEKHSDEDMLRFYLAPSLYKKYQREMAGRNTTLGDQMSVAKNGLYYEGVKLVKFSKLKNDKIMLTKSKNFQIGYGLTMTVESERNIKARARDYVIAGELDANYALSEALILAKKV